MAGFEVAMPIVGVLVGGIAGDFLGRYADFVAVLLLAGLGLWMLRPGGEDEEEERLALLGRTQGLAVIGLGLSISLDEVAMGVTFGLLELPLVPVLALVFLQALIASQVGLRLGSRIGERNRERAERAAGVILLLLAAFLLLVHLV